MMYLSAVLTITAPIERHGLRPLSWWDYHWPSVIMLLVGLGLIGLTYIIFYLIDGRESNGKSTKGF